MAVCRRLLVVCGRLLVVCGRLLVVCGRLLVVCGRLCSFVVVACFSNYALRIYFPVLNSQIAKTSYSF